MGKVFGGGVSTPSPPPTIDYEAERKKADEAAMRKRQDQMEQGLSGTILGGSKGGSEQVAGKHLLGQ